MDTQKNLSPWLFFYCLVGAYGALWISDEFDEARAMLFGFFAIPFAITFFTLCLMEPKRVFNSSKLIWWIYGVLFATFSWGHILMINALTSSKTQGVRVLYKDIEQDRAMSLSLRKGGLGMLYRLRW